MSIQLMNEGFAKKYGLSDVDASKKQKSKKVIKENLNTKNKKPSKTHNAKHSRIIKESVLQARRTPRFINVHLTEGQIRKLNVFRKQLSESNMSPEDKRDSDMLRTIASKIDKRANAKLSKEEKDLLDRLGVTIAKYNNGSRILATQDGKPHSDITDVFQEIDKFDRTNYSYLDGKRVKANNGNYDKANLADMVRKSRTRSAENRGLEKATFSSDLETRHTYKPYHYAHNVENGDGETKISTKPYRSSWRQSHTKDVAVDGERETQNNKLGANYNKMKDLIATKKESDKSMEDANKNFAKREQSTNDYHQAKIDKAQRELDLAKIEKEWSHKFNRERYEDETVGARKRKDDAQSEIDKMLKKESIKPLRNKAKLVERGLTRAERHNRMLQKAFDNFNARANRMADFLKANGVSEEEIEELKSNTGLGRDALLQKLIDMNLKDKFFATDK